MNGSLRRTYLPDCMMPDGGEGPCKGYSQLECVVNAAERVYRLLSKINGLGQALADLEKALEECK